MASVAFQGDEIIYFKLGKLVDSNIYGIMLDKFKCVKCIVPLQMLFLAGKDQ